MPAEGAIAWSENEIAALGAKVAALKVSMARVIIGQENVIDSLIICLLAGGHALVVLFLRDRTRCQQALARQRIAIPAIVPEAPVGGPHDRHLASHPGHERGEELHAHD